MARPAGASSHSARSQKTLGVAPNRAASMAASVASTSRVRRSYSASSRMSARTSAPSPGRAGRRDKDMPLSSALDGQGARGRGGKREQEGAGQDAADYSSPTRRVAPHPASTSSISAATKKRAL